MADRARRLTPNLIALLVLAALAAGVMAWQRPWERDSATSAFPVDAERALTDQFAALSEARDADAFAEAAGNTAWAEDVWASRTALGVDSVRWAYVRGGTVADAPDGSGLALVRVSADRGHDSVLGAGAESALFGVRVKPAGKGFEFIGAERTKDSVPIWSMGEITVTTGDGWRLLRLDGGRDTELDAEVAAARAGVVEVVPRAAADLLVVAPKTRGQAADALGQKSSDISQIAAVTTHLGGGRDRPTAIVLNPKVFADMNAEARQIVMTHEATHMMTGAIDRPAPAWVKEGFADFVALHHVTASPEKHAREGLAAVRKNGPPANLPTAGDYSNGTHGLGGLYELTWLIFVKLAADHGDRAVVDFYGDTLAGSVESALQADFGTTIPELTADWQAYLKQLAG